MQLNEAMRRKLVLIQGKGGVGRTTLSHAMARTLADEGKRVLWVCFEDPLIPVGETRHLGGGLHELNCESLAAFDEYLGIKIGVSSVARFFVNNRLIRYLAKATPGLKELVLIGKVWFEIPKYDHVIVDMPSTGYSLTMFQSVVNFGRLFQTGPLYHDTIAMARTFGDSAATAHLIVALPEEMPLREGDELRGYLKDWFPNNPPAFVVNRCFPKTDLSGLELDPARWPRPIADGPADHARKRHALELRNLEHLREVWRSEPGLKFDTLPMIIGAASREQAEAGLVRVLKEMR